MRTRNIILIIVVVNVAWGGFYLATTTPSLAWPGEWQHDAGEHQMDKWKAEIMREREAVLEAQRQECVGVFEREIEIMEYILPLVSTEREYYALDAAINDELTEAAGYVYWQMVGDCDDVVGESFMDDQEYIARVNATNTLFRDLPVN